MYTVYASVRILSYHDVRIAWSRMGDANNGSGARYGMVTKWYL